MLKYIVSKSASISVKMFCRLCLVSPKNYQLLDGEILENVEEILRNKLLNGTEDPDKDPIVCVNCVMKVEKAFEFKSTCENTKVTLSHYMGLQENAKLDLRMIYLVEKEPGKEVYCYEKLKICRTCLNMIESGVYACLLDSIKINDLEDIFELYIPELVLSLTESPLICGKCINNFMCYSEIITKFLDTENKMKYFSKEIDHRGSNGYDVNMWNDKNTHVEVNRESKIMKLFKDEHRNLLDIYSKNDGEFIVKENEKIITNTVIQEDIDLFYKESPNSELNVDSDNELRGSESDSYQSESDINQKFFLSKNVKNSKHDDYKIFGLDEIPNSIDDDSSEASSPEGESSSSNKLMGPEKWFNNTTKQLETNKNKRTKSKKKQRHKRTPTKEPKISKSTLIKSMKCRRFYGVENKEVWCIQCRWKKACSRLLKIV